MKHLFKTLIILSAVMLCIGCNNEKESELDKHPEAAENSIYYWKTQFDIDSVEMAFLHKHNIKRLYLRMFDVAIEQNFETGKPEVVPIATTKFVSAIPHSIEIVPVTYITIDALRAMAGKECEFASLITERLLAMSRYNECGVIKEVQLDCDWTKTTKESYYMLCSEVKTILQTHDIELSTTIRLHQLRETPPPAHRGVLMIYNTGAIKDRNTRNSILDIADVKPYLKKKQYPMSLDYAYPVFGWGVKFDGGEFVSIVSDPDSASRADNNMRYERPTPAEIMAVKELVEQKLGKPSRGNILYHLDESQLKNYTTDEISKILSY